MMIVREAPFLPVVDKIPPSGVANAVISSLLVSSASSFPGLVRGVRGR